MPIFIIPFLIVYDTCRLTVGVTGRWAGVDFAWKQYKFEARKMPVNRADSQPSAARRVGQFIAYPLRFRPTSRAATL